MSFFKVFKNLGLISLFLMMCSITVHAHIITLVTGPKGFRGVELKGLQDPDISDAEFIDILDQLDIRINTNLPSDVLQEFKDTGGDPTRLFRSKNFRKTQKGAYLAGPDNDVFSLNHYRSAIEVLQSENHAAFFFSLFNPRDMEQVDGLFLGLRVHKIAHREIGHDETMEIANQLRTTNLWEEWVQFKGMAMAEKAFSEGQLRVGVIDIEASFFSAFGRENYLLSHRPPVKDSFRNFTDELIARAEESGELVDLYKNPYCNLPVESPYRRKFLSAVRKSDLSDSDFILKWWQDAKLLAETPGGEKEFLKGYMKPAFENARRGSHFSRRNFGTDPFISQLTKAARDDESLREAMQEVMDSLFQDSGNTIII